MLLAIEKEKAKKKAEAKASILQRMDT